MISCFFHKKMWLENTIHIIFHQQYNVSAATPFAIRYKTVIYFMIKKKN